LYSVNLLSLALLAYGAWCMVETLRRHKSALPPIEIVIESYQVHEKFSDPATMLPPSPDLVVGVITGGD
jgi:hypothetical protein